MTTPQVAAVMCMFLRDNCECSPDDEMSVTLTFGRFAVLLQNFESYSFVQRKATLLQGLLASPPSSRIDVVSRWVFPLLILVQVIFFFSAVPLYQAQEE
eukprot:CAMPEP_0170309736 /NCGR_PEP_ID=MMETSP0116_2-20130129/55338_1 /TAXON_ID=400756 /ORGANISM="Durinskia baltica, Strain CSIRO CS-38" /LENGTH=98 /DNA_ID=CAMNT_0010561979 /DNA_START=78 /DNA_END=374 /DNA_ORIENTATION=+